MSDTTERDAVRAEFYARHHHEFRTLAAVRAAVRDAMADEIVRLRQRAERAERILAALREPSEAIRNKVLEGYAHFIKFSSWDSEDIWTVVIRTTVAAAEQEVGRE